MKNDIEIQTFLRKNEAFAKVSAYRYRRFKRIPYNDWRYSSEADPFASVDYTEEPYVELHIPTCRLQDLLDQGKRLRDLECNYDSSRNLIHRMHEEERIRRANPGVEKAYRNYQLLLELARK